MKPPGGRILRKKRLLKKWLKFQGDSLSKRLLTMGNGPHYHLSCGYSGHLKEDGTCPKCGELHPWYRG